MFPENLQSPPSNFERGERESGSEMRTISLGLGISVNSTSSNASSASSSVLISKSPLSFPPRKLWPSTSLSRTSDNRPLPPSPPSTKSAGVCQASQVTELFSTVSPEIVVREARLEDCWDVAETHCSSFFPEYSFPLDFVLRIDRLVGMVFGLSVPSGCKRSCLVAVIGSSEDDAFYIGRDDLKIGGFDGKLSLSRGYVTGILTVDTVADFLPRKGPLRQKRTGIAYISNVAVREKFRRRGIAKRLIAKAEVQARSWGCRAIALHCDLNNSGATKLYRSQGFKCIKVPYGANWPQPRTSPDMQFSFMMKLVRAPTKSGIQLSIVNEN